MDLHEDGNIRVGGGLLSTKRENELIRDTVRAAERFSRESLSLPMAEMEEKVREDYIFLSSFKVNFISTLYLQPSTGFYKDYILLFSFHRSIG